MPWRMAPGRKNGIPHVGRFRHLALPVRDGQAKHRAEQLITLRIIWQSTVIVGGKSPSQSV